MSLNWTGIVEHITDAGAETTTVNMPTGNVELTANFAEIHVSIEELVEADIKIFPNPARSKFTIESYKNINHIRLVDINGQVIKDKAMN